MHMAMAINAERICVTSTSVPTKFIILRRVIASLSVICVAMIAIFYYRHNRYCEAYVYSLFCLSEYVSIVLNMVFHLVGAYIGWLSVAVTDKTDVNDNLTQKGSYTVLKI